ncbi:MAG: G5 domain-containing protein, partial [Clostridia bacterium]
DGEIPAAEETEAEQLCRKKEKHSFKKFGWAYGLAAAFALLLFVTFAYTSLVPREVNATINGQNYKVESKAFTIDEFLDEQHIKYCEDDYISRPVTTFIYDGISFKLKHATDFKVTADGKTKNYKTLCRTVGDALKDCKIKVGDADIVTPGLDTEIGDGLKVVIQRVTTSQETVEEDVDFNTIEKDDPSMEEGKSKVETEGSKGRDKVTYEITYIDGVESERKEISRETVTAAVDKVILNGTKISFNGKSYSRKLVVKAYSYTGGGWTAMSTRARVGEIAVDPRVIPLGSKVYIEGVGARIAEDTGGNIKGNTIDIYMNSEAECRKWGVRTVTIYIQ